jgi:hypothetical protein
MHKGFKEILQNHIVLKVERYRSNTLFIKSTTMASDISQGFNNSFSFVLNPEYALGERREGKKRNKIKWFGNFGIASLW